MSDQRWRGGDLRASGKRSWRDDSSRNNDYEGRHRGERRANYRAPAQQQQRNPNEPRGLRFRVPRADDLQRQDQRCTLSKPTEIGHFSKYGDGEIRFDRSNLLRYKEPAVGVNLLHGIENYVPKEELDPDAHPAPIAPVLAALEHFQATQQQQETDKSPHFVTFRNNLNKIMGVQNEIEPSLYTPYNTSSEWTFLAEKRDGCMYLDVRRTQSDVDGSRNMHENQKRGMYAGRQFEIFCTHGKDAANIHSSEASDEEAEKPDSERVVNENEEYCGLFSTTLSGKRLVVAAEIDCFDGAAATAAATEDQHYVELKTFRVLQREKDTFVFERFKLLAFWIQSFVVGIPKIVCGFRNDDFEICKLQTFKTTDIPSFCRKYWSPTVCLNFTSSFLDWLYAEAQEGKVYQATYSPRAHAIDMVELLESNGSSKSARSFLVPGPGSSQAE